MKKIACDVCGDTVGVFGFSIHLEYNSARKKIIDLDICSLECISKLHIILKTDFGVTK